MAAGTVSLRKHSEMITSAEVETRQVYLRVWAGAPLTHTSEEGHVGLLGVKRAPRQTVDLLPIKLKVIQLMEAQKSPTH